MNTGKLVGSILGLLVLAGAALAGDYPVVGTGQDACFDDSRQRRCPQPGQPRQ